MSSADLTTLVMDLEFSTRTQNVLRNADIATVGALVRMRERDLLRLPNCGRRTLNEIKDVLERMELKLATEHKGLPVAGYVSQSDHNVALVNANKVLEERVLRTIDSLHVARKPAMGPHGQSVWVQSYSEHWLGVARTHIEQGFMALNRAIFQPARVALPEDTP